MAKILVYNNNSNRMEIYYRNLNDSMPYITNRTLKVGEFRGVSESDILWTDRRCMLAWNSFRYIYGKPIFVGFAFIFKPKLYKNLFNSFILSISGSSCTLYTKGASSQ